MPLLANGSSAVALREEPEEAGASQGQLVEIKFKAPRAGKYDLTLLCISGEPLACSCRPVSGACACRLEGCPVELATGCCKADPWKPCSLLQIPLHGLGLWGHCLRS